MIPVLGNPFIQDIEYFYFNQHNTVPPPSHPFPLTNHFDISSASLHKTKFDFQMILGFVCISHF